MKKTLFLMALVLASAVPAAQPAWQIAANRTVSDMEKARKLNTEIFAALAKDRAQPDVATNAAARAYYDRQMVEQCVLPSNYRIKLFRDSLGGDLERICRAALADPGYTEADKRWFARALATFYANARRFADAETVAKGVKGGAIILFDVYRWQDRFDEALAELRKALAEPRPSDEVAKKATLLGYDLGKPELDAEFWARFGEYARLCYYGNPWGGLGEWRRPPFAEDLAFAYVTNPTNPPAARAQIAMCFFGDTRDARSVRARASLRGLGFGGKSVRFLEWAVQKASDRADHGLVAELWDLFPGAKELADVRIRRLIVRGLLGAGRKEEAAALAKVSAEEIKGLTDLDRAKFAAFAELATSGFADRTIAACGLQPSDKLGLVRFVARTVNNLGWSEALEKYSAEYEGFYVKNEPRVMNVTFSAHPVMSISDWRAMLPKLDSQRCDRPFKVSEAFLDTDVSTGRVRTDANAARDDAGPMEFSAVCDAYGVHLFLRTPDKRARAIEARFANGMNTEMYLAPGDACAYTCLLSTPREGMRGSFDTLYDSAEHRRIDITGSVKPGMFRSETQFTDEDYVLHMFFAWSNFPGHVPGDGQGDWRFECLVWAPGGSVSWGGSHGIHHYSEWGRLHFDLKPEEIAAVRRGLLLANYRTWTQEGLLDVFDRWSDDQVGDPEFYAKELKDVERELRALADEVTPTMSDADANRIYGKACVRWQNFRFEIGERRRKYLLRKLTE